MNSSHIKTFLIVLLLAANIFVGWNIIHSSARRGTLPGDMLEDASALLARSGVTVKKEDIPDKKPTNAVYEGEFSQRGCEEAAGVLAGGEEVTGSNALPGGGVGVSTNGYEFEFSPDMSFSMQKSNFTADGKVLELLSIEDTQAGYEHNTKALARIKTRLDSFLAQKSGEKTSYNLAFCEEVDGDPNKICVRVIRVIDGLEVWGHSLSIYFEDGNVVQAAGRWYFGPLIGKYNPPLLDAVNVLFSAVGGDSPIHGEIDGICLAYSIIWQHQTDKFYLIPSWELIFADGTQMLFNTLTGNSI